MRFDSRWCTLSILAFAIALATLPPSLGFSQSRPKVTANRYELAEEVTNEQFKRLDAELSSYEQQAEKSPRAEMNVIVAFATFDVPLNLLQTINIGKWAAAAPGSYSASLARAINVLAAAESGKERRYVQTDSDRWEVLRDRHYERDARNSPPQTDSDRLKALLRIANGALARALELNPNFGLAYAEQIRLESLLGDRKALQAVEAEALSRVPASFAVREQIMFALDRSLGNSREAIRQLADSSQQYAAVNPSMSFLKGWPAIEIGDEFKTENKLQAAAAYYTEALKLGGDYWLAYCRRAQAYYAMQRWNDALRDATRANELFPNNLESIKLIATASARLNRPAQSILAIADWVLFEPMDSEAFALNDAEAAAFKASGGKDTPADIAAIRTWQAEHNLPSLVNNSAGNQGGAESAAGSGGKMPANIGEPKSAVPGGPYHDLCRAALAAYDAGNFELALSYASQLLNEGAEHTDDLYYGDTIFYGYLVNGLVPLKRNGDVGLAENFLLAAGRTPGSPALDRFGPNMKLAKELLARNEKFKVLKFIELCGRFWRTGHATLNNWVSTIKTGGTPDFGPNLNYN
ncbi:MAG: hypothetical protein ACREQI_00530 [Candidatus Binataceae bacterium]